MHRDELFLMEFDQLVLLNVFLINKVMMIHFTFCAPIFFRSYLIFLRYVFDFNVAVTEQEKKTFLMPLKFSSSSLLQFISKLEFLELSCCFFHRNAVA